jgi:hypothetical protein
MSADANEGVKGVGRATGESLLVLA